MRSKIRLTIFVIFLFMLMTAFRPINAATVDLEPGHRLGQVIKSVGGQLISKWQDRFERIADWWPALVTAQAEIGPGVDEPMAWQPTFNLPRPSEFQGSVSYAYPIMSPPGINGLQPSVGLNYSSFGSNGSTGKPIA